MSYLNQPLGTIISSILNYDELCKVIREEPAVLTTSSYVPCDGRSIKESTLEKITRDRRDSDPITKAPDLRGKFLRGLNMMYSPGNPAGFDPKKTGDPDGADRIAGDWQADAYASHSHEVSDSGPRFLRPNPPGGGTGIQSNAGLQASDASPGISIKPNGGEETRPRNSAVYFYLKIN